MIWTLVSLPPEMVTETLTLPKRDVPVPEYVPSAYVAVGVPVVEVADAPITAGDVLTSVEVVLVVLPTGLAAADATVAAAGWVETRPVR